MRLHEVVTSAYSVLAQAPLEYSQVKVDPRTGYRLDCSGKVTEMFRGPKPGYSTVTLVTRGIMTALPTWNHAQPGDFWGRMGWNTGGDAGHVGCIVGTPNTDGAWVIIDHGRAGGPFKRRFSVPPSGYLPYRLVGIEDGTNMRLGDRILAYGAMGEDVKEWQNILMSKGISVGPDGADGDFGPNTKAGTVAFQQKVGISPADGIVNALTLHRAWGSSIDSTSKTALVDATNRMTEALTVVKNVVTTL